MAGESRRVVVTGIGPVTPVGIGVDRFWSSLVAGEYGVGKLEAFDPTPFTSRIAAEVHDFRPEDHMEPSDTRRMGRFAQFALAGSRLAIADARLELSSMEPSRVWLGCRPLGFFATTVMVSVRSSPSPSNALLLQFRLWLPLPLQPPGPRRETSLPRPCTEI